jgi:hypothetical protein
VSLVIDEERHSSEVINWQGDSKFLRGISNLGPRASYVVILVLVAMERLERGSSVWNCHPPRPTVSGIIQMHFEAGSFREYDNVCGLKNPSALAKWLCRIGGGRD